MYAVISTGGKQYRVAPGDKVRIETIAAEIGAELEFTGLIAASDADGRMLTGSDLDNAKVLATVSGQDRADKVLVFKFKRKKQYKRLKGHRQNYTELTIGDVRL
jgi:large subunit ribosomal protein L21